MSRRLNQEPVTARPNEAEGKQTYGVVVRDARSEFSNDCLKVHPILTGNSIQIAEN